MKQKGFTLVEVLLIVLVLSVLSFIGWFVWSKNNDSTKKQATKVTADQPVATPPAASPVAEPAVKDEVVKTTEYEVSVPAGWTKTVNSEDAQCNPGKKQEDVSVKKGSQTITISANQCGKDFADDGTIYYSVDSNSKLVLKSRTIDYCSEAESNFCVAGDNQLMISLGNQSGVEKTSDTFIYFSDGATKTPTKESLEKIYDILETIKFL
jgi:Tfp pilus assembly protein PilE